VAHGLGAALDNRGPGANRASGCECRVRHYRIHPGGHPECGSQGTNTPAQRGGKITINGRVIVVPDNLIVQMPAASFKWAELFDPAVSTPVGTYVPARPVQPANRTGLALNDPLANHFPSYEVRVVGNIITDPATGVQRYIAGLIVPAAQQGLNGQSGTSTLSTMPPAGSASAGPWATPPPGPCGAQ